MSSSPLERDFVTSLVFVKNHALRNVAATGREIRYVETCSVLHWLER